MNLSPDSPTAHLLTVFGSRKVIVSETEEKFRVFLLVYAVAIDVVSIQQVWNVWCVDCCVVRHAVRQSTDRQQ
jgi:hypothetical protein